LLDDVVLDQRDGAIRKIDAVADCAGRLVLNTRVLDNGVAGPTFYLMSNHRIVEITINNGQGADLVDVRLWVYPSPAPLWANSLDFIVMLPVGLAAASRPS